MTEVTFCDLALLAGRAGADAVERNDKMEDLMMISRTTWRFAARAAAAGALAVGMLTVGVASAQAAQAAQAEPDPITTGCQVQGGTTVPDLRPNPANPTKTDVERAIVAWLNEVCTVDPFLEAPRR
ncbi:hypothetical protein AB0D14_43680 [Streptomyces sp. NPDC048484]|uniref:hypothetical protein n=1 Tax=Streptomyces sp. NPDC048484 TaxID=3155146 RepID=UPI00344865CF